jgi:cytochrome P450
VTAAFVPDDPDFYLADPYPAFRRLRREDPVHWSEGAGLWCLLKHADVAHVSRNPQLFTSTRGIQMGMEATNARPEGIPPTILEMDPPAHNRHRKLVIRAFTPRAIAALEPRIRQIARESLDEISAGETLDFIESMAVPLPMYVIAEMLGVPREDRDDFKRWSDAMIEAGGSGRTPESDVCTVELFGYFQQHLVERRREPRGDVLSMLAHAEIDGDRLTDPEILIFCLTLLVAGNETTRNLISGAVQALCEHPLQKRKLLAAPSLVPNAVEEVLRWWTPVWSFVRRATRDTELRGRRIAEGQALLLLYPSANRDEEVWGDDAESFDVTRSFHHRRHLSFGFGEHLCLGASLARLEARVTFEELLARFPGFELAGPIRPLRSRLMHGIEHMPVKFAA